MKKPTAWLLVALGVAGAAVAFFLTRDTSHEPRLGEARVIDARDTSRSDTPFAARPARRAKPSDTTIQGVRVASVVDDLETLEEYNNAPQFIREVLKEDLVLAEVFYYRQRVLLNEKEREQYHALLSDTWMFDKVRDDLLYPPEIHESLKSNTKRLMEIDYLRDALAWKENPERDNILTMIEEIILEDNFRDDLGMDMRISLSGNKMELFALLKEHSPAQAASLVEGSRGTRLGKLIAFIEAEVEAQARRERQNSVSPL